MEIKELLGRMKKTLSGLKIKDYTNKTKKLLFDHHKKIVVAIMEQNPVLQIMNKSDLQIHNYIADEESIIIELIRSDLL